MITRPAATPASADDWFVGGLMAGFECTTYRRRDGIRLDVSAATGHDRRTAEDYALVAAHGMPAIRDGLLWHRIERVPGWYDWSLFDRMLDAAEATGVRVMWDVVHFGWPDWVDPLSNDFADRVAALAQGAAERVGPGAAFVPINEISFLSWACGEEGFMHPHLSGEGDAVKRALCAAAIRAAQAIRDVDPTIPIACAEPLVAVHPASPDDADWARGAHEAQYQALDTLIGRRHPELGGSPDLIDFIGLNHYPHSQWVVGHQLAPPELHEMSHLLLEAAARYDKPLFIAETGCEGDERAAWFSYAMAEMDRANRAGADVRAACLYPILNHLGWQDDRYCPNGLFCGVSGERVVHEPLARAIADWRAGRLTDAPRPDFTPPPAPLPVDADAGRVLVDA